MEIERRREVEERYADIQEGTAAASGGGDWKEANSVGGAERSLKRARSPDEDGMRMVKFVFGSPVPVSLIISSLSEPAL
jgi:nuclear cap-binding protein subunit 2